MAYNKFKFIKNVPDRFLMPDGPSEWQSDKYTLFRTFELHRVDIEILIDAVKQRFGDAKGNKLHTKERLIGILWSMHSVANAKNIHRHYHPKSWMIVQLWWEMRRKFHWIFNTKFYRNQIELCKIAKEVIEDE